MALWDLKFQPSLGALQAYARRRGLGALGISSSDKEKLRAALEAHEAAVAGAKRSVQKAVSMRTVDRVLRLYGADPITGSQSAEWAQGVVRWIQREMEPKGYTSVDEYLTALQEAKAGDSGKVKPKVAEEREAKISRSKVRGYKRVQTSVERTEKTITDIAAESFKSWGDYQRKLYSTGFQSRALRQSAQYVDTAGNSAGTVEASIAAADMLQFVVTGFNALNTLWKEAKEGQFAQGGQVYSRFLELAGGARIRLLDPSLTRWDYLLVGQAFETKLSLADYAAGMRAFATKPVKKDEKSGKKKEEEDTYDEYKARQDTVAAMIALNIPQAGVNAPEYELRRLTDWVLSIIWTNMRLLVAGAPRATEKLVNMSRMKSAIDEAAVLSLMGEVVTSLWAVQPAAALRAGVPVLPETKRRALHGGLAWTLQEIDRATTGAWSNENHSMPNGEFVKQAGLLQRALVRHIDFLAKRRTGQDWTPNVSRMAAEQVLESARGELEESAAEKAQSARIEAWIDGLQEKLQTTIEQKKLDPSVLMRAADQMEQISLGTKRNVLEQRQLIVALNGFLANIQKNLGSKRTLALDKLTTRAGVPKYDLARGQIFGTYGDAASMLWKLWSTQTSSIYQKVASTSEAYRFYQMSRRRKTDGPTGRRQSWGSRQMETSPFRQEQIVKLPSGEERRLWAWSDGASGRLAWSEIEKCTRANARLGLSDTKGQRARDYVELSPVIDVDGNEMHNFIYHYYLQRGLREQFEGSGVTRTVIVTELFFRHPTWRQLVSAEELKPLSAELRFELARKFVEADAKLPPEERLGLEMPAMAKAADDEQDPVVKARLREKAFNSYESTASQRRAFTNALALQINIAVASFEQFDILPFELIVGVLKTASAAPLKSLFKVPEGGRPLTKADVRGRIEEMARSLNKINSALGTFEQALTRQQEELSQQDNPLAGLLEGFTLPAFQDAKKLYEEHYNILMDSAGKLYEAAGGGK